MTALIDLSDRHKKRFSDFAEPADVLDGEKMPIEQVLNQEIKVIGHKIGPSKFSKSGGTCLTLQFLLENQRRVLFTGSEVLIEQLRQYGAEIPFWATIRKIDRYYTLT